MEGAMSNSITRKQWTAPGQLEQLVCFGSEEGRDTDHVVKVGILP